MARRRSESRSGLTQTRTNEPTSTCTALQLGRLQFTWLKRLFLMHQPTDWLAARQPPDRCLEEPRAGQLLSLALGHLAVRVDAALMIAPPGLTRIRSLRTGSVRSVLFCLHDLKRSLKHSRHHLQRDLTAWDCSRLYCHPASASCKMELVLLLLIRASLVPRARRQSTGIYQS